MSKKIKISSIFLATSLIVTPISNVVLQNHNVAKADYFIKDEQKDNVYKILEPNVKIKDGKISLENRDEIKKEIINNWQYIKLETEYESPEELYLSIEKHFNNLEYKSNKKYIEVKPNGEIKEKFQTREVWPEHVGRAFSDPNYHVQYHWWGQLHFLYTDEVSYRFAKEMNNLGLKGHNVAEFGQYIIPGIASLIRLDANKCFTIANEVNYNASLPGNGVELSVKHWGEVNCKPRS